MCLAARVATALVAASVVRQALPDSAAPPARSRLFDAAERLDLRLTADFGAIAKQRGTEKKAQPGVLSYVSPAGDSVKLDVQLSTRGHFRLGRCQHPPLKITFDKAQKAQTMFAPRWTSPKCTVQWPGFQPLANHPHESCRCYRA